MKLRPVVFNLVLSVLVCTVWGAASCGDSEPSKIPEGVPLAALTYFWFGFDLTTGESIGGLKSSHWNLDVGSHGSRVGVTDEPAYGFYASDDPNVIGQQLEDMEKAGISVIIASWHGDGDSDFDGQVDDQEKKAMNRALTALLEYIAEHSAPFEVAILVEPYMVEPNSLTVAHKQAILDDLWDRYYGRYPDLMFEWEGKPLVVPWGPVDLNEPGDTRFTIKNWDSDPNPNWKTEARRGSGFLDWNWYPDVSVLPHMLSDDGVFVVFPRFDEYWLYIMGRDFGRPYRRVDPTLTESVYEQTWQAAVDHRDEIELIVLYCWNEHEEHASIEPDKGISPVSYGRTLIEKTATYYAQFLAGDPIEAVEP